MNNLEDNQDIFNSKKENQNEINKNLIEEKESINEINENLIEEKESINEIKENSNEKIKDLVKQNNDLYKENKDLKEKLKRYPFNLEKDEKLMSIIISSKDEKILYSLICKNNNTINDIEKEIYKVYPEYPQVNNIFLYKGKKIGKFQTLESNNIKNGDILILEQENI